MKKRDVEKEEDERTGQTRLSTSKLSVVDLGGVGRGRSRGRGTPLVLGIWWYV